MWVHPNGIYVVRASQLCAPSFPRLSDIVPVFLKFEPQNPPRMFPAFFKKKNISALSIVPALQRIGGAENLILGLGWYLGTLIASMFTA